MSFILIREAIFHIVSKITMLKTWIRSLFRHIYDIRYFQKLSSFRHILGGHVYVSDSSNQHQVMLWNGGESSNSTQRGFVTGDNYDRNIFSTDVEYRYLSPFIDDKLSGTFANFGKTKRNQFFWRSWLAHWWWLWIKVFLYHEDACRLDFAWIGHFCSHFYLKSPFPYMK